LDANQQTEIDESPIERSDMDGQILEAGIYQASDNTATAIIEEFSIQDQRIHVSGFE
jgi:hypothetical protein